MVVVLVVPVELMALVVRMQVNGQGGVVVGECGVGMCSGCVVKGRRWWCWVVVVWVCAGGVVDVWV